jgi:type 1 fimbriae regulatory protein FimB/type 1 fimbriae regulatory protein FimE
VNRYGHRDATMILIAFRHGLRPVEVCNLKWDSIELAKPRIHVNRAKNGEPSTHPLSGVELRALRRLKRESIPAGTSWPMTGAILEPFSTTWATRASSTPYTKLSPDRFRDFWRD